MGLAPLSTGAGQNRKAPCTIHPLLCGLSDRTARGRDNTSRVVWMSTRTPFQMTGRRTRWSRTSPGQQILPWIHTPLMQQEQDDSRPSTVGKRTQAQAAPVDRMPVGDIIYRGSNTPSCPAGKTRLVSNSSAPAVAISGRSSSVKWAVRHFHLL